MLLSFTLWEYTDSLIYQEARPSGLFITDFREGIQEALRGSIQNLPGTAFLEKMPLKKAIRLVTTPPTLQQIVLPS